ncbi:ribonuclease P protein component [bacterium]|nr:ribonuclease P protein component [bacterium]
MPAHYRLSRADFTRMRGFKRVHGTLFSLSFGTLPDRSSPGFACVVSAKIAPRANTRNLIKRRARAAVQRALPRLSPGVALVFYAKKPATEADAARIRSEIFALARKSGNSID